jgi:ribosomal protein S14
MTIFKDNKKRLLFARIELQNMCYKYTTLNEGVDSSIRQQIAIANHRSSKGFGKASIVNHCTVTGRSRGVFRKFRLSRLVLKRYIAAGLLNGMKKSSW